MFGVLARSSDIANIDLSVERIDFGKSLFNGIAYLLWAYKYSNSYI